LLDAIYAMCIQYILVAPQCIVVYCKTVCSDNYIFSVYDYIC